MDKIRAFVAIELSDPVKRNIIKSTELLNVPGIKLLAASQLHITIFFLGNIDEKELLDIEAALLKMEKRVFDISLKGVGAFTPQNPRIVYAKIEQPGADEIIGVYNALHGDILSIGIKFEERGFTPHVTVARVEGTGKEVLVGAFLRENQDRTFGSFTCKEIKLIKSTLTEKGPIYEILYSRSLL